MANIHIDDLKLYGYHGVFPEENIKGQNFIFSVDMVLSDKAKMHSDDLDDTINYGLVCDIIARINKDNTFKLIETLADTAAEELLNTFSLLEKAIVTVKKPDAPVNYDFNYVSVTSRREWKKVIVAVGSNIGNSKEIIDSALKDIKEIKGIRNIKCSGIIKTKPYGVTDQPDFLNGCIKLETYMNPYELLDALHEIENRYGRERLVHWGARTLDLDIILFGSSVIEDEILKIPHEDMHNREFVLKPLCEIDKNAFHPVFRKTAEELYKELKGRQEQ